MFTKGQPVVKVISIKGLKSATVQYVDCVDGNTVWLNGSSLTYHSSNGLEIDTVIPDCYSEIIPFDNGEAEHLGL